MGYGLNITGERGGVMGKKLGMGTLLFSFVPCSLTRAFGWILRSSLVLFQIVHIRSVQFRVPFRSVPQSVPFSSVPFHSVPFRYIMFFVILLMMTNWNLSKVFWYFYVITLTWQLYISRRYFGIFTLYNPDMATIHFSKVFWYFYVI